MRTLYEEVTDFLIKDGLDISLKVYSREAYNRGQKLGSPFFRELAATGIDL